MSSANNSGTAGGNREEADSDSDDFMVKVNKFQDEDDGVARRGVNAPGPNRRTFGDVEDEPEDDQHGALVKKILESKEQLDYDNDPNRNREVLINSQNK